VPARPDLAAFRRARDAGRDARSHQPHRGPHSWSIKRFVRIARRYRTIQIRAGQQILTAKDPLPPDLRDALALITRSGDAHSFDKSQGKPGQA
jgi:hypothetical protein